VKKPFVRERPIRAWIAVFIVALAVGIVGRITHWNRVAASAKPDTLLLRATMNCDLPSIDSSWERADAAERANALISAAMMGHETAVKRLLELGTDPNAQTICGRRALHLAAVAPGHLEIARALVRAGANVDACDELGWTALMLAEQDDNLEMIEFLQRAAQESLDPEDRAHPSSQQCAR
jgi:ankyrin repeat protein